MKLHDLVEDREGDKAVVREVLDDGYVRIEWDCRPGTLACIHESHLSNLSARVDEERNSKTAQHEAGLRAARRYAGWHLGYQSWGDNIIHAYLNPEAAIKALDAEEAKYDAA